MTTDVQEANALSHKNDIIDIYTVTSGVPDSGSEVDGPGMLAKMALKDGATEVRNDPCDSAHIYRMCKHNVLLVWGRT